MGRNGTGIRRTRSPGDRSRLGVLASGFSPAPYRLVLAALAFGGLVAACETPDAPEGTDRAGESAAGSTDEREASLPPSGVEPLRAPSFEAAADAGRIELVVLYVPSEGFAHGDGEGRLTGVTVELMRDFGAWVEARLGIDTEVRFEEEEDWPTFYRRVRYSEGGVFGIGNVTITEPRRDELAFSPSYLTNVAVLITHAEVPELESMEEIGERFAGLAAVPFSGTLHEERLEAIRDEHFPDMEMVPVGSNDRLLELVASGEGYFGYVDVYNYWRATEQGTPLRRHAVGDDASEDFGVIMPRGSDWEPVIRAFFEEGEGLRASARYRELLATHLGDEMARLLLAAR
jgi:hypothetical protein